MFLIFRTLYSSLPIRCQNSSYTFNNTHTSSKLLCKPARGSALGQSQVWWDERRVPLKSEQATTCTVSAQTLTYVEELTQGHVLLLWGLIIALGLLMSLNVGWQRRLDVCWYQVGPQPGTHPAVAANEKTVWCVWRRRRTNHFQISQNRSQESPITQRRSATRVHENTQTLRSAALRQI